MRVPWRGHEARSHFTGSWRITGFYSALAEKAVVIIEIADLEILRWIQGTDNHPDFVASICESRARLYFLRSDYAITLRRLPNGEHNITARLAEKAGVLQYSSIWSDNILAAVVHLF